MPQGGISGLGDPLRRLCLLGAAQHVVHTPTCLAWAALSLLPPQDPSWDAAIEHHPDAHHHSSTHQPHMGTSGMGWGAAGGVQEPATDREDEWF